MKTWCLKSKAEAGGLLYYLLGVAVVVGAALAGFLTLVSNENVSAQRSQSWNTCIAVAEAGIEEALAHINYSGLTNLGSQNWSSESNGYAIERDIGDCRYEVRVTSDDPPIIRCSGYVPLPLGKGQALSRTVEARTSRQNMFPKAIIAKETIDLKGNNVNVDSYISTDSKFSTGGRYDGSKRRDHGDVATNSSITNSVNTGNANIAGHVSTGPNGSVKVGPNSSIGDLTWSTTKKAGIQDGYFTDDMNVALPPVRQPYTSGDMPNSGTVNGTNYDYILGDANYLLPTINNNTIIVTGNATLLVTDTFKLSQGFIYITPGATLTLYVSAPTVTISGNGIVNANSSANSFYYFGLPGNTSVSYSGNSTFTGCVYAPNADITLGGGGSTPLDFSGAIVCKSLVMNGNYNIHYDEDLAKTSPALLYVGSTWNEL